MKNKKLKKKKAFTLIEVIVSIFVFVIIITASSGIFFSTVSSVRKARELQQNLERAQLALNEIPKTLRTSKIKFNNVLNLVVYDYSRTDNNCINYRFNAGQGALRVGRADLEFDECVDQNSVASAPGFTGFKDIIDTHIENVEFLVIDSDPSTVGRVTISALVCREAGCTGDEEVYIQSTVSLRSAL